MRGARRRSAFYYRTGRTVGRASPRGMLRGFRMALDEIMGVCADPIGANGRLHCGQAGLARVRRIEFTDIHGFLPLRDDKNPSAELQATAI